MEPSGWGGFGRDRGSLVPVVWAASAGGIGPVLRLLRDRRDGRAVADRGSPGAGAGARRGAGGCRDGRAVAHGGFPVAGGGSRLAAAGGADGRAVADRGFP